MKRSKKYKEAAAKVIKDHLYTPLEAVTLAKETSTVKYNASVEVALVLGVDPKKADQAIRSTVNLPHGTGKTSRVLAFANGANGGKIEFRVDKNSNLHFLIGKVSFTAEQLAENYAAAMEEVMRAKPNSSKGRYVQKAVVSTTMGPGIAVDPNLVREPVAN